MRQLLILALAFTAGVAVRDASGQSAAPPVELGVDVTATLDGNSSFQRGPRVIVNFDGSNSMQFTASLQKLSPWGDAQKETDLYLAAYRRLVRAEGPVRVSATVGGGLQRTAIFVPATTFGNPPVTFPSSSGVEITPALTTGASIDVRLGTRAAIVLEPSVLVTDRLGARFSAGLIVPVGSYQSRPPRLARSVAWADLDPGERAWVTTADGREVDGEVVNRSPATLTLRTRTGVVSFTADDVRAIDTTDPIRNGTVLGAVIGALGAAMPAILATGLVCTLEDGCDTRDVLYINSLLLGIGTGIGAATGALADSLREHRVPLYRRGGSTKVELAPLLGRRRLGGRMMIRW